MNHNHHHAKENGGVVLVRNSIDKRGTYIMMPTPPSSTTIASTNNATSPRKYKSNHPLIPTLEIDQLNSTTSILNALISSEELNPNLQDSSFKKSNGPISARKITPNNPSSARGSRLYSSNNPSNMTAARPSTYRSGNGNAPTTPRAYQYYQAPPPQITNSLAATTISGSKTPRETSPNLYSKLQKTPTGTSSTKVKKIIKTPSARTIKKIPSTTNGLSNTNSINTYITPRPPPKTQAPTTLNLGSLATDEVDLAEQQSAPAHSARRYHINQPAHTISQPPSQPVPSQQNLKLNINNINKDSIEFEGFGSGIPESIKTARNITNIKQVATTAMPLSARATGITTSTVDTFQIPQKSDEPKVADTASLISSSSNPSSRSSSVRSMRNNQTYKFSDPITPAAAIKMYGEFLTDYEQSEIFDYQKIYCIGSTTRKVRGTVNVNEELNYGYDDDRGDYKLVLNDHIGYRYEIVGFLGKGSFGQVVKAHDVKENKFVALKVIRNRKRFHAQALVEVKILKHLNDNDKDGRHHCIEMSSHFTFRHHLCITFELLSINLYEFIKNNNFRGLSLALIRKFALQILNSLQYLSEQKIIHCDLKPENLLLVSSTKSDIKMIDFGSSCFENERIYTYIQSRFYRSPEVILGISYNRAIDMWSFGCILAELYTGYPLFPGRNELEQLGYIMEVMGMPSKKVIQLSTRRKKFFDSNNQPRLVVNKKTGKKRIPGSVTLQQALDCPDRKFVSFLEGCLRWDPVERFTPHEAFQHEWILEALQGAAQKSTLPELN